MTLQPAPADEDKTWLDEDVDEPTVVHPPLEGNPEDPSAEWDDRVASANRAAEILGDKATPEGIIVIASWLLGESQPTT